MNNTKIDASSKTVNNNHKVKAQAAGYDLICSAALEPLFEKFNSSLDGLSDLEAGNRLKEYGYNEPAKKKKRTALWQFFSKFLNPLVIVLIIIGTFSYFFGEKISAFLVLLMILLSVILSFVQEYRSGREAEKLGEMVRATATVIRKGKKKEVKIRELVPGDIVDLYAGDMIPADLRILSCKDLFSLRAKILTARFTEVGRVWVGVAVQFRIAGELDSASECVFIRIEEHAALIEASSRAVRLQLSDIGSYE